MKSHAAKQIARQWVTEAAVTTPGFYGAYFAGSINWLPDEAELPPTSDIDITVVYASDTSPSKLGKFVYHGVTLEVSHTPRDQLASPEVILSDYRIAGSFHVPSVIADPSGELTQLQTAVAQEYTRRTWVYRRCEDARANLLRHAANLDPTRPFHDQVTAWLFATGVTTHVLLAAGLKNPTVRRRCLAARELLAEVGRLDFYETLLELLGCARMSQARANEHLNALAPAFDAAAGVIKSPFPFAADLTAGARPIAIDGSRELIETGYPREAVFWLVATYARCQKVLYEDAPADLYHQFDPGFRALVGDLGIASLADLQRRTQQTLDFLPSLWAVAEAIIAANPEIEE